MTNRYGISRRTMLLTGGGLVVAGGLSFSPTVGAQTPGEGLTLLTTNPRNAQPELSRLVQSWLTPNSLFYVRSHAPNPVIQPAEFRLSVEGMVRRPTVFTLQDLSNFPARSTTATLTCAGNRRAEFNREAKVGGVQWESGAIGNATWGGVSLADVLRHVEVEANARHVWFEGLDEISKGDGIIPFGGSIPMEKALVAESAAAPLLAHTMNGEPLHADHGFPLRTVVPGYIGARSVKWLGKIVVSDRPSPNHYVANAYKIVRNMQPLDWMESGPIYRFPINAAICTPTPNAGVAPGIVELSGYVLPTGRPGSLVDQVLISSDRGESWSPAELTGTDTEFCWQLWKATVTVGAATTHLIARATDTSGGFMPERVPWNAKGYLQNSWYRLPIRVG